MVITFRNCRHNFGESLRFDVVVDGIYPEGEHSIWLHQPGEIYRRDGFDPITLPSPSAYLSIPNPECAKEVVNAINDYHLCNVFRKGEPIYVRLCWENAPDVDWQISH